MAIDWARHIIIGLIAALVVSGVVTWGSKRPPDKQGWRNIRPGGTYAFGIGLGAALTLGMAYVWLFVGSSRADGAEQMRILFWLIIAFGIGTLITLFQYGQARRTGIRWRGDVLNWRGRGGAEQSARLSEVVALRKAFMGPIYIVLADGSEIRVDPFATNALLLIETLSKRLNPEDA